MDSPTIEKELKLLGIEQKYFDRFYQKLKENNEVPSQKEFSNEQYHRIMVYLQSKRVLNQNNKVIGKPLKLFEAKKNLEDLLEQQEKERWGKYKYEGIGRSGGFLPCRQSPLRSRGGMAPCRDDDSDPYLISK